MFVSHTIHTQQKINEFTSLAIGNVYYVNFRIKNKRAYLDNEIQNQRLEVLRNTFNLHSNFTYAQEVWSFNQFICMCSKENKRVAYNHIHTISINLKIMYVSLLIYK